MGIVGAGQLARMLCEAASTLGVHVVVLAERADDAAALVAPDVVLGAPGDLDALRQLAQRSTVVTFDHEQVNLEALATIEREGAVLHPGIATLEMAVDKAEMRARLERAGLPTPAYLAVARPGADRACAQVEAFAAEHGWPVVVKAARGGYDGRGVFVVGGTDAARRVCEQAERDATPLLVEEHCAIDAEVAVAVARRPGGQAVAWPPVETAQVEGMCREVLFPGRLERDVVEEARALGTDVAEAAGATGVLAVELFLSGGKLVVNEIAARPHNSAHWTIEGAVTSQFENHLRAVLDLPLGSTQPAAAHVASVNVLGPPEGHVPHLRRALSVEGAHLHVYGKQPRPGRKLGHVTVCGDDPRSVRRRAWEAARALGTPVPPSIRLEDGEDAAGG